MELDIKSDYLLERLNKCAEIDKKESLLKDDENKWEKLCSEYSQEELGFDTLFGYIVSLFSAADRNNIALNLTYESLRHLPAALNALFRDQKQIYSDNMNKEIIGKTIGAYFNLLCANETGCSIEIEKVPDRKDRDIDDAMRAFLMERTWVGCRILTGTLKRVDFRGAGLDCLNFAPFEVEDGAFVDMTPIIDLYKEATGVDLNDYDIANVIISGKKPAPHKKKRKKK